MSDVPTTVSEVDRLAHQLHKERAEHAQERLAWVERDLTQRYQLGPKDGYDAATGTITRVASSDAKEAPASQPAQSPASKGRNGAAAAAPPHA